MKDCLIIGFPTALMYKNVYPLLLDKVLKVGIWTLKWIIVKDKSVVGAYWFTTLQVNRPKEKKLKLTKTYNPDDYPRFDNAPDIIECKKNVLIPKDYQGKIGVPISFLKYYPELDYEVLEHRGDLKLNGKQKFERLIIRRKQL